MKTEHLIFAAFLLTPGRISGQIDVTRSLFTPVVVSETQTDPIRSAHRRRENCGFLTPVPAKDEDFDVGRP